MSSLDIRKLINYSVDGKHIFLQDVTHPKQIKTVFGEALDEGLSEYQSTAVLDVGMRKWRIEIAPNDLSVDKVNSLLYWVVLIVGSSLSLFISYNFIQLIRQRRIVEKTVQERTSEIEDAKHFQDLIMSHIPDFVFVLPPYIESIK